MKIALLASNPRLYSNKRLMEEAEKRGHEITFLQLEKCYMSITEQVPSIHAHTGDIITSIDAIIPRIKPAATFYGTAILRHFELMGATCLNGSVPIARSRDKLRSLQLLARKGIRMPATGFANTPADSRDLVKMVGGAPLVIKLLESTQGAGVVLAETNNAAESVITAFKRLKANFLVQEFIEESQGEDLRCFVIGNRVIASIKRKAADGDFRSNLHRGGAASDVKITPEEEKMAIQCANYLGLMVAGVDLLRSDRGPMVLEVNSSPGLEGIENFTGKNVAGTMIEYLEKEASRKNPPLLNLFRHLPHKKKTPSASKVEGSGKTNG